MARQSKKSKAKVEDQSALFLSAIADLAKEKGIPVEFLFEAMEAAFKSAYKKNYGSDQNVEVSISRETGEYHVYALKNVVEADELVNAVEEISLPMAQQINPDYALGDIIRIEVTPRNFGRIAAQAAKQVVVQKIREAERGIIYDEYQNRENDIITGTVNRIENQNVFINLGRTEAILTVNEQMPEDDYQQGDRLKAYVLEVRNANKGPQIMVSRTHPGLLKRLFELEVPEIHDGVVEIKAVTREPGMRSKIAVYAEDESIDAVGSCVGPKGTRVQNVVNELHNEKIDIVEWDPDPAQFIANALSPAKVDSVAVDEEAKISRVVVPDQQLSLAIGKEGQNARLAAKLTGWKIDIKSESQAENEPEDYDEFDEPKVDDTETQEKSEDNENIEESLLDEDILADLAKDEIAAADEENK